MANFVDRTVARSVVYLRVQPSHRWLQLIIDDTYIENTETALMVQQILLEGWQNNRDDDWGAKILSNDGSTIVDERVAVVTGIISKFGLSVGMTHVKNVDHMVHVARLDTDPTKTWFMIY